MNIRMIGNVATPLDMLVRRENSRIPCSKHPENIHALELWSLPDSTAQERLEAIQRVMPLCEGEHHTVSYANTGITHKIKPTAAPQILEMAPVLKILLTFQKI